jgi:branched-chain amino acid transport system permease protein
VGPVIGCVLIQWLSTEIGTQQAFNSNLVLGAILVVFVLLVPRGILPSLGDLIDAGYRRLRFPHANDAPAPGAATEPTR